MSYAACAVLRRGSTWDWVEARRLLRLRRSPNIGGDRQLLALSARDGVVPRAPDGGRQLPSEETVSAYWHVEPEDLVFNPMWAIEGGVAVSEIAGAVSTAYRVYEISPSIHPRFLHYLLRSQTALDQYRLLIRGVTTFDRSVGREDFEAMPIPVPPLDEQRAIADHLDAETARIDALIEKKQRMIELLEEREQSLLDSVIDADSSPRQLRRCTTRITSGPRDWAGRTTDDGGTPFYRIADVSLAKSNVLSAATARVLPPEGDQGRLALRPGDLLMTITADIGSVARLPNELPSGYFSQHVAAITPADCDPAWLAFAIRAQSSQRQLEVAQYGGTKVQLSLGDVASLRVPWVPRDEQVKRARQLAQQLDRSAELRDAQEASIELLRERRQAVITGATSGHVNIRAAA